MLKIYFVAAAFQISLTLTTSAFAADTADVQKTLNTTLPRTTEIELALSAAPPSLRADATVYVFGAKGYELARSGTNGFTCLVNRDGFLYGSTAFKPTCWDADGKTSYVPVMLRVGELLAAGHGADAVRTDIDAGFADGRFHRPTRTGVAYMLAGDVNLDPKTGAITKQAFTGHYMIYAPGVSNGDIGAAQNVGPNAGAEKEMPFIFDRGAGGANLAYLIAIPEHVHAP